jgi:hypothetical protein
MEFDRTWCIITIISNVLAFLLGWLVVWVHKRGYWSYYRWKFNNWYTEKFKQEEKIQAHECTGSTIPGIIRPYPNLLCSSCRLQDIMSGKSKNIHISRAQMKAHNERLKKANEQRRQKENPGSVS